MDQESFKNTVFILKDKLFRLARRILVSEDEAFDVVQDILVKLWEKRMELSEIQNIEAYAVRMVNNECITRIRRHDRRESYKQSQEIQLTTEHRVEDLKPIILKFINKLPEKQRMVIHLKDVEDYDLKEIAEVLEIEEGAVRVNLTRARKKIKEQLEIFFKNERKEIKRTTSINASK
ncbi:RNA polymerase sigma factor [Faecalibacter sp. LW9]|uniref:RNA polymerase sigma factor n=1 Tax=Faecalibacter sp. LW9 TaxID=3103144 RepID=UPI002AFFCFFA|nr:RNA polymerase sigma factor [Faecalibacter sp. LW9]